MTFPYHINSGLERGPKTDTSYGLNRSGKSCSSESLSNQ
jgi:hypothetical protein